MKALKNSYKGVVTKVVYNTEENPFKVFMLYAIEDGFRLEINARGNFPGLNVVSGLELELSGKWVVDEKYGEQFEVESYEIAKPSNKRAVKAYLEAFVPGIGAVASQKIVKYFGDSVIEVLNNDPQRIKEVSGLKEKQIKSFLEQWVGRKDFREVAVFLQSYDISPLFVRRIFEKFGSETKEKLLENPYALIEIGGIGFNRADQIGLKLGMDKDSPLRAKAFIVYVLDEEMRREGHLFLTFRHLVKALKYENANNLSQSMKLSLIDSDGALKFCKELEEEGKVVLEEDRVYLSDFFIFESQAAALLVDFFGKPRYASADIEEFIQKYQDKNKILFSSEQKEVLRKVPETKVLVITGLPGVGKTFLLKTIADFFKEQGLSFTLLTPTGIAAKNLSAVAGYPAYTIHRCLGYRGDEWAYNAQNKYSTDAVIVDEFSMVDQRVMFALLDSLRDNTVLVFVGDSAQLPSVQPGNVLQELISSGCVDVVNLKEIYRQDDLSDIITAAHKINNGERLDLRLKNSKNDFVLFQVEDDDLLLDKVKRLAQTLKKQKKNFQILSPVNRGKIGVNNLNIVLKEVLNPIEKQKEISLAEGINFREKDRIIVTKNDYDKQVFNGECGIVKSIDLKKTEMAIKIDGVEDEVLFSFEEARDLLKLSYCITVHKSQGLEYDIVLLVFTERLKRSLKRNLLYTALTRAKRKCILFGSLFAINKAIKNDSSKKRNTKFAERVRDFYKIKKDFLD